MQVRACKLHLMLVWAPDIAVGVASPAMLLAPAPEVRAAAAGVMSAALLARPGGGRAFGVTAAMLALAPLAQGCLGALGGPGGSAAGLLLVLGWLLAATLPAAVAADRWWRQAGRRLERALRAPYFRAVLAAYASVLGSVAAISVTASARDPVVPSIELALVGAVGAAAWAAVREDRSRAVS